MMHTCLNDQPKTDKENKHMRKFIKQMLWDFNEMLCYVPD